MLNIKIAGSGKPVLLIHGFLESNNMWVGLGFDSCRMYMVDLPGHGRSPMIGATSLRQIAEQIVLEIPELSEGKFSIIGHSLGGYVALDLAKLVPVKKLMLLNSNFWQDSPEKKLDRERVAALVLRHKLKFISEAIPNLFYFKQEFEAEIKQLIKEANEMDPEVIASYSHLMKSREDNHDIIEELGPKTTVVQGEHDAVVPIQVMLPKLESTNTNLFVLNAGHMAHVEAKSDLQFLINRWTTN